MFKRSKREFHIQRVLNERQLEDVRRRQASVIAQLKALTKQVQMMIPPDSPEEVHGHNSAH